MLIALARQVMNIATELVRLHHFGGASLMVGGS
jgi:hypothetical protein